MSGREVIAAIETKVAQVRYCADGVVEIRMREGAVVELPEMEEVLAAQVRVAPGPYLVLVDARPVNSMTREAQERTADTASDRDTRAVAILIGSPVSVLLGNFFLTLSRPVYPTRLFRNEEHARAWLLSYRPDGA